MHKNSKYTIGLRMFCVFNVAELRLLFILCFLIFFNAAPIRAQLPSDSERLLEMFKNDTTDMEVLSLLAQSYEHTEPTKAKKYANRLIRNRNFAKKEHQARAYNTLANCALLEGNLDLAEQNYGIAIELIQGTERSWFVAVYQSSLAQIYLNRGQHKEAIFTYREALEVLENTRSEDVKYYISVVYGGLGDAYNQLGLYDLALKNLHETQKINGQLNDPISIGITYNSIAAVYDNLSELDQSRKYNLMALEYFEQADYPLAIGTVLLNLAQNEFKSNRIDLAQNYLFRSEKTLLDFGTTYNLAEVKLLQAELAQQNFDMNQAMEDLAEAHKLFDNEGNLYGLGRTKFQMGLLNHTIDNQEKAYLHLEEALRIFTVGEFLKDKKLALQKLLEFSILDKKLDESAKYFNELNAAEGAFLNEERLKAIAAQEVLYETEKKETQLAEQALEIEKEKSAKLFAYFGIALLIVLFIGIWFWIKSQNKRKNLESINALLSFQKSFIQKELEQLNKQLDPHEIKNLLASISPEIQEKAPETYRKMLKLLNIVKSSLSGKITQDLNEQIQQAHDFLNLEQQRFSPSFEFKIIRNVSGENLKVPRLLIKNLVENAIKHGLRNISYPGLINITIDLKDEVIRISVEDNGRGRKVGDTSDSGIGTTTYKRLFELLNLRNERKASFEIIDLEQGTRVEVNIPVGYRFE